MTSRRKIRRDEAEAAARAELERITPPNAELLKLADKKGLLIGRKALERFP